MTVRVQSEDFDVGAAYEEAVANSRSAGAVVTFVGRVRDFQSEEEHTRVESIFLEHYPSMTFQELEKIETEARTRWPIEECLIVHRYGELFPGDQIVLVITTSPHRKAAFESAQFLMDWLKTRAPFWKKERTPDGSRWVDAKESDDEAADRWSR